MSSETFQEYKIRDLGSFRNGVNFKKDQKGVESSDSFALINVKDIFSGGRYLDFESMDSVALPDLKNIDRYLVQKGDLFFVRSSVKRDGIALVSMAQTAQTQAVHCGFVIRFRLESEIADRLFLVYLLRDAHYREELKNLSGGAAITNISQDGLGNLSVFLPPLPTQRKIASILSAYDDLIENNTRRIAILEEMAQAIYREWFVHFRFPGHEKVKLVESPLGKIPVGWEVIEISKYCDIRSSKRVFAKDYCESGVPFYRGKEIIEKQQGAIDVSNTLFISEEKFAELCSKLGAPQPGDLLLTSVGTLGVPYVVRPGERFYFKDGNLTWFRDYTGINASFLYCWLLSPAGKAELAKATIGSSQQAFTIVLLKSMQIACPPIDSAQHTPTLLDQFQDVVGPLLSSAFNLAKKNNNLRTARDLLLPKLISGQLDVEDLDIESVEPHTEMVA
ncbi:restriction endonuclease subunit S [Bythopirellula polymerisocia]|uniref:EcoKI restriction-modification system protein HsdS n=1 Tax=Bythopirellula polymerisocia TaxID=2528003 RepID=A0A5C6D0F9_9BACT|nr:restriction endonuclease subunit S [Bythopirellula polymerisocia]TWU29645.1 EcoKI restriction-modification system protein HsdS [Bythopirellula polymerisocia]